MRNALALVSVLLLAGCTDLREPTSVDIAFEAAPVADAAVATLPGELEVLNVTYDFGMMVVTRPTGAYPVRLLGNLYTPDAEGPHPLVVLLHGNHFTCRFGDSWPTSLYLPGLCGTLPDTTREPSHQGYGYLATTLASHGHVVISLDANDINDHNAFDAVQYGASERGQLVLRTIDEIAQLAAEGSSHALAGQVDLTRIGLMGHSRGGEGVVVAAIQNEARETPHALRAIVALAPTDFGRHLVPAGIPFLTLLPYCDGDVYSLHGARMFDDARRHERNDAPIVQALVMGANHNFYNEVWDVDDARFRGEDDPECGEEMPTRPTADAQRLAGLALMGGFLRAHLEGNATLAGALEPGARLPEAACAPALAPSCDGALLVATFPPSGERAVLFQPRNDADMDTLLLGGFDAADVCEPDGARDIEERTVDNTVGTRFPPERENLCPTDTLNVGSANQLMLEWSSPGALLAIGVPEGAAKGMRAFSLRAGLDPAATEANVTLHARFLDADGAAVNLTLADALRPPPGDVYRRIVLSDVLLPLDGLGIDPARLALVELTLDGPVKGRLQVGDILLRG